MCEPKHGTTIAITSVCLGVVWCFCWLYYGIMKGIHEDKTCSEVGWWTHCPALNHCVFALNVSNVNFILFLTVSCPVYQETKFFLFQGKPFKNPCCHDICHRQVNSGWKCTNSETLSLSLCKTLYLSYFNIIALPFFCGQNSKQDGLADSRTVPRSSSSGLRRPRFPVVLLPVVLTFMPFLYPPPGLQPAP